MIAKVVSAPAPGMIHALKESLPIGAAGRFLTIACVAAAVSLASTVGAMAAPPKGQHTGSAFGTRGDIATGPLVGQLGTTAYVGMPCLGTGGSRISGDAVSPSVGLLGVTLRAHVVATSVQTTSAGQRSTDEVVSRVEGVRALGGLVTASSIVAVSRTIARRDSVTSDDLGTSFADLVIAGQPIAAQVSPNTTVAIPGVGVATLRRTSSSGDGVNQSSHSVDMIAIQVNVANTLGLPVGAEIIIGHADSGFQRGLPDVLYSGDAYATDVGANVAGLVSVGAGATALQTIQCAGTNGETEIERSTGIQIPGVASAGAVITRVYGGRNTARANAKLENLSLLNGLINVRSIRAVAETKLVGRRVIRSTEGTTIADLTVLGLRVNSITPNLVIALPGIGSLTVNEQIIPDDDDPTAETVVNALRISVTKNNLLGLPVGTKIIIGHAAAGVSKPRSGV
jgi:hypothetical protein